MYRVFNMGLGAVLAVAAEDAGTLLRELPGAILAGEIVTRTADGDRVLLA
ncbi:MAG: hypothetical protein U0531_18685 [Dehalococcoidia bacterium]